MSLPAFPHDVAEVTAFLRSAGWAGPALSAAVICGSSVLLVFPTALIVFANAVVWGLWWGSLLTLAACLIAAVLCYFLARRFGRPLVERIARGKRSRAALETTDRFFERFGGRAVLLGRLIPVLPFDLVSLVAGLADVKFGSFLLATVVGLIPETFLLSWLASIGGRAHDAQGFLLALLAFVVVVVLISVVQKPLISRMLGEGKVAGVGESLGAGEDRDT